jgi:hypothetical protein
MERYGQVYEHLFYQFFDQLFGLIQTIAGCNGYQPSDRTTELLYSMLFDKTPIMPYTFLLILFMCLGFNASAQSNSYYKGKIVKSKGTCTWLIRITEAKDLVFKDKLIEPTGNLPDYFLKRGTKIQFEMHPLRQPVSDGCKANVVASIVNPEKL